MVLLVFAALGCVAGFVLTKKHLHRIQNAEEGVVSTVAKKAIKDGRRSFIIGHTIVRMQFSRAFIATARKYAPVPITFSHAALSNYLPIAATATGGTLIVVAFCRLALQRLRRVNDPREQQNGVAQIDHENVVVSACEAVIGLAMYTRGTAAWHAGPLRGGLSVFGASPDLDRCASRERYLAEKLAEFSGVATGGIASLTHLSHLTVTEKDIQDTVGSMIKYAKRSAGMQNLLLAPEVGEAWGEFAHRVMIHRQDMKGIANKIYYPTVPGVRGAEAHKALMVVNATDSVKRFASSSKDCASVMVKLMQELGSARAGWLGALASAFVLGAAFGSEAVQWWPFGAANEAQELDAQD